MHASKRLVTYGRCKSCVLVACIEMGYWDIPDGTDCGQKTWLATKVSTVVGVIGTAYHIVLFPPKTVLEGVQRAGSANLVMASLGAIFGMTTCVAAEMREKPDDPLNYFIGGCASGMLLGVKSHSYTTGTAACVALGAVAAGVKMARNEGMIIIPSRAEE
ncbi:NADH dehydrogenase [ubiquinone] 1 alpha subcomplex subunit 11 [Hyperolius riggenbachi]|uniref:NADH dehydrogenase [ubiquinone] 1 alpha subcomplex subunit 11 n=1 Tax=Hyperolius riggenbachi TaxID=752182 RepID=UPI0035A33816